MDNITPNNIESISSKKVSVILQIVKKNSGSLWHYGHFIHDFIVPMINHLITKQVRYDHIYLDYREISCKIGSFKPIAEKILGIPITEVTSEDLTLLELNNLETIKIFTIGFGPYNPIVFKSIVPYMKSQLKLSYSPYKIILIERGRSKLIGPSNNQINGKDRRTISNHKQLNTSLSNRFGSMFKNVILEELSIEEQVSLFMNARIIIGQHGAGLCNILWIENPNSLIIEFPPHGVDTFMNMSKAIGFDYIRLKSTQIDQIINKCSEALINYSINQDI